MCFFNGGNIGGTISSKILCLVFVQTCFVLYMCQDEFRRIDRICGLITCTQIKVGDILKFVFSPDIISCS